MNQSISRFKPLFALGFRPFFLGGALFALGSMLVWQAILSNHVSLPVSGLSAISWHAHAMLFGYGMAIVAGFLLTAVRNWTGVATLNGMTLMGLFCLWIIARLCPFLPYSQALQLMAAMDLLFTLLLCAAVAQPIIAVKQWRQLGILTKLLLLGLSNALFYAGVFGWVSNGVHIGLYAGLYLMTALILTMLRRLIPFFTERGVGYDVTLRNRRWLDAGSLIFFLFFLIADVFLNAKPAAAVFAVVLTIVHSIRLADWYTPGIWRKPLLWSLHIGYAVIVSGFALYAASVFGGISPFLSVHAFAVGGIGIITFSMISRVSLGHTGRNVHKPPYAIHFLLGALVLSAVSRVFLPLLFPSLYFFWLNLSQILWSWAFVGFLVIYLPILISPRLDGQPG